MQYPPNNIRLVTQNILEYIVVLFIILECRSVYTYMLIDLINDVLFRGTLFLLGLLVLLARKGNIHILKTIGFILLYGCWLLPSIIKILPQNQLSYICRFYFLIILFVVYLACNRQNYYNLLSKYVNLIVFLSVFSVIMWLLCSIFQILPLDYTVPYYWTPNVKLINSYYYLYFETQNSLFCGIPIVRNTAIFTEAPMYNFHLCLALLALLFLKKERSITKVSILSLTILTTFSTTGQLFLLISFFLKFLLSEFSLKYKIMVWFISLILGVVLVFVGNEILENKKQANNSYAIRITDMKKEFRMWEQNPIMGVGYGNSTNKNSSNSTFFILANGGIYLFSLYCFSILIYPFIKMKSIRLKVFFVLFFVLFSITIVPNSIVVFLIISFSFSRIISKKHCCN